MIVIPVTELLKVTERPAFYADHPRRAHIIGGSDPNSKIHIFSKTNEIIVISGKVAGTSSSPVSTAQYANQSIVTVIPEEYPASSPPASLSSDNRLAADIFALKRLSGLTWDGIAELANSSRQSVHKWTLGGAISHNNRLRISRLLIALRSVDQGTPKETHAFLVGTALDGRMLYDHLKEGHFEEIAAAYGDSAALSDESWSKVDVRPGEPPALQTQLDSVADEDLGVIQPVQSKPIRRFRMKTA